MKFCGLTPPTLRRNDETDVIVKAITEQPSGQPEAVKYFMRRKNAKMARRNAIRLTQCRDQLRAPRPITFAATAITIALEVIMPWHDNCIVICLKLCRSQLHEQILLSATRGQ